MGKALWLAASLACILESPVAFADLGNRQVIPLGEREAFMANTGTGDAADAGAVYYNPASLTQINSDRMSILGSVYLSFSTSSDSVAQIDNTAVPYSARGFNTVPVTFVITRKLSDWALAFSVLIPESLQVENRTTFQTPNTTGTLLQSYRLADTWVGISAAHELDSQWSVGASLFGILHSQTNTAASVVDLTSGTFVTVNARSQMSTFGLSLDAGVLFKASSWVSLGLRVQSPILQASGSADAYRALRTNSGNPVTEDLSGTKAYYQLPLDSTLGAAFTFSPKFELLTDLSWEAGTTYDSIPASVQNTHYSAALTPRFNIGAEYKPAPAYPIRAGFFYNPSAISYEASVNPDVAPVQENYFGVTAGLGVVYPHVETGLGVFYIWSHGQEFPSGAAPGVTANVASNGFGAMLTTAYVF